jgi:hypothetical protein
MVEAILVQPALDQCGQFLALGMQACNGLRQFGADSRAVG